MVRIIDKMTRRVGLQHSFLKNRALDIFKK